ncbi:unnamed protein product [Acanthoscelides obtectus]|uniref:Uncharacterized protein n=1 Tax=Acanthoscelides obtectus TaxID=200917 RepID=A0A9P0QHE3_ACAOB|nr:unnamed protein product [Acanthoscelides obtectus]CAK1684319.1 hypothetical protein AOBTE_LOCUS34802 [Acanthoscelides obtectus]
MLEEDDAIVNTGKVWTEWTMVKESAIEIEGQVLNISVAYSGRLACAYKYGKSFTRPNKNNQILGLSTCASPYMNVNQLVDLNGF